MYCRRRPARLQPSAGKMQTVTAISELVGDAGRRAGADVTAVDAGR